jgi:hypothetical protein
MNVFKVIHRISMLGNLFNTSIKIGKRSTLSISKLNIINNFLLVELIKSRLYSINLK